MPGKCHCLALRDIIEKDKSTSFGAVWDISKANLVMGQGGCLQEARRNQKKQQGRKMGRRHWERGVIQSSLSSPGLFLLQLRNMRCVLVQNPYQPDCEFWEIDP